MSSIRLLCISLLLITSTSLFAEFPKHALPDNQWEMVSLPLTPPTDENTVSAVFGDDFDGYTYKVDWVLYAFNAQTNQYGSPLKLDDKLHPGMGYWIIQKTGGTRLLDMPRHSFYTKPNPFEIILEPAKDDNKYQWNLVGLPFNTRTKFGDLALSGVYNTLWRYGYKDGKGGYEKILDAEDTLEPWDAFWTASKGNGGSMITATTFGMEGSNEIVIWEHPAGDSILYRPKGVEKRPVIFFAPGWGVKPNDPKKGKCEEKYSTLLKFVAGQGYAIICNQTNNQTIKPENIFEHFEDAVKYDEVKNSINLKKIGILGHSSGGGHAFRILKKFSDNGWGEDGRFLFVMEQWFAFDMKAKDMEALKDTNVVFLQFGKYGNNDGRIYPQGKYQDPRILLTEYALLTGIKPEEKDYQIFSDSGHLYPQNDRKKSLEYESIHPSDMQGVLRSLHALMHYTFDTKKTEKARKAALEVGTDEPYQNSYQKLHKPADYKFGCYNDDMYKHWYWFDHCGDYAANMK